MRHVKCYRENYPRPQFVRGDYTSLDGVWKFAFDEENIGERENWQKGGAFPLEIVVPYSYHTEKSGIGREAPCDNVWYRRTFSFSKGEGRVLLHFDGCDYLAKVWLNGIFLGAHEGGYARFTFDATNAIADGENTLTVKCEDAADILQPRGKQRWTPQSASCFYTETTGIWKSVWMERVPARYIERVSQDILFEQDSVRYCYRVKDPKPGMRLRVEAEFDGVKLAAATADVTDGYGEIVLRLVNKHKLLPMKYWSPAQPNLYDVTYTLFEDGKPTDVVGSYSALVRYDTYGGSFRLNYFPSVYLRMALDQGYFGKGGLTGEPCELERDVKLLKELGFNGVRKHEKIEDERFCYFCDVYGLLLWCEMPSFYAFAEDSVARLSAQWQEVLLQYRNFPCIMAYVSFNESWGVMHVSENGREQSFTRAMYHLTKTICPDRLAISNDGWDHTESDLVTIHNYEGTGQGILDSYADMAGFLSGERVKGLLTRAPFCKGYAYGGQPVVLSECVGITFEQDTENGGWGYGKAARDSEDFLARLKSILDAVRSVPACAGFCITQIADVMQEKNGLLTEERAPKAPLARMREIILG